MDRVKGEVIIPGKKETNDSATAQKFQSSVSTTNHKRELNPFFHRISLYCGLIPQLGASLDLFFFSKKKLTITGQNHYAASVLLVFTD